MERIAIIDLGSNSVRLVITEIDKDSSFRIINEVKETVRLSEDMGDENTLKADAIQRTLKTLRLFRNLCEASRVDKLIAVATAAVRKANNKKDFIKLIELDTGIEFEVISGEREAELGFMGIQYTLDVENGFSMDIGGASTEITLFINKIIVDSISLPFGAVNLTEMFLSKNQSTQKQLDNLEKFLTKQYKSIKWLKEIKNELPLVGLGGTIRTLCKVDRYNKAYSLDMTHNYNMTQADIEAIYNDIRLKSYEERCSIQGISKDRADIIVAGACAVNVLLKTINTNRFIVSGSGIRDGLFYNYYFSKYNNGRIKDIGSFSISNFLKLYKVNTVHAEHVTKLSLNAFDQLLSVHKLTKEYRDLLEKAAMMHDAGITIDFYNRDEHTYYMITNSRITGLTHREIVLIALIASKYTGNKLKRYYMKHRDIFFKEDYTSIKKLIMLLTICDKLDRSKIGIIREIECSIKTDKVLIDTAKSGGDGELEIAEANKLQGSFLKLFRKNLLIK